MNTGRTVAIVGVVLPMAVATAMMARGYVGFVVLTGPLLAAAALVVGVAQKEARRGATIVLVSGRVAVAWALSWDAWRPRRRPCLAMPTIAAIIRPLQGRAACSR